MPILERRRRLEASGQFGCARPALYPGHYALGVDCLGCGARDDRPIQVQAARAWSMAVSMLVGS